MNLSPLTLSKVCNFLGLQVPEHLREFSDHEFPRATAAWSLPNSPSLHFSRGVTPAEVDKLRAVGVPMLVDVAQRFDTAGNPIPTLIHPDPGEAYLRLMREIKKSSSATTIAITGSNGKTTCKEMVRLVCSTQFKTHWSKGNSNVFGRVGNTIQELSPEAEVYVQETGAASPGIIERAARMLEPDAAVIVNIGMSHIGDYGGSHEAVISDKLSLDKHLKDDGVVFINADDPILRKREFQHRVVSFGLSVPDADYTAEEVTEEGGILSFKILERETNNRTPVLLHTVGQHNVANAVSAFAVGRWLGIEPDAIARGLANYRPGGTRQNLLEANGQRVLVDCFNASEVAMVNIAETVASMSVGAGGKRRLVLADIGSLGADTETVHRQIGKSIARFSEIDRVYCFGPSSRWIAEEARELGQDVFHTEDRAELHKTLLEETLDADLLAFKGGAKAALSLTVDYLFGTDFLYADPYQWKSSIQTHDSVTYRVIDGYGVEVKEVEPGSVDLHLGGEVAGEPVLMIGQNACARTRVEKVEIGSPVRSIATRAFYGCKELRSVKLPATLRTINKGAFNECSALEEVVLPEGLATIRSNAFRNCKSLRHIVIPRSVKTIEPGAFRGCGRVVIHCYEGSPSAAILSERLAPAQFRLL